MCPSAVVVAVPGMAAVTAAVAADSNRQISELAGVAAADLTAVPIDPKKNEAKPNPIDSSNSTRTPMQKTIVRIHTDSW